MKKKKVLLEAIPCVGNKEQTVTHYDSKTPVLIPKTYAPKTEEFRASWIATVGNIDLPRCLNKQQYQKAYTDALDALVTVRANAVFVQIRPMNDAFYASSLNPYSRYLCTSTSEYIEGEDPGWDVLGFFIEEAHKRNLQFHAWLNPYRVSASKGIDLEEMGVDDICALRDEQLKELHPTNFARKYPHTLVMAKDGQLILNPALPEVRKFLVDTIEEIIQRYPIDGFHFDDYFYPSKGLCTVMDDKESYVKYGKGKSLEDFRRASVTALIRDCKMLANRMNKEGKRVLFGVSPFAIYRNKKSYAEGSNSLGSEAYTKWYADLKLWVEEELLHYIVPQIYWEFEHKVAPFADILDWWSALMKNSKVHLYIGIPMSRIQDNHPTIDDTTIPNMLRYAQKDDVVKGFVIWNNKKLFPSSDLVLTKTQDALRKMWKKKAKLPIVDESIL